MQTNGLHYVPLHSNTDVYSTLLLTLTLRLSMKWEVNTCVNQHFWFRTFFNEMYSIYAYRHKKAGKKQLTCMPSGQSEQQSLDRTNNKANATKRRNPLIPLYKKKHPDYPDAFDWQRRLN